MLCLFLSVNMVHYINKEDDIEILQHFLIVFFVNNIHWKTFLIDRESKHENDFILRNLLWLLTTFLAHVLYMFQIFLDHLDMHVLQVLNLLVWNL